MVWSRRRHWWNSTSERLEEILQSFVVKASRHLIERYNMRFSPFLFFHAEHHLPSSTEQTPRNGPTVLH